MRRRAGLRSEPSPGGSSVAGLKKGAAFVLRFFLLRFALFVAAVQIAHQLPGAVKGVAWIGVFAVGLWAYLALVREVRALWDCLVPRGARFWRHLDAVWSRRRLLLAALSLTCGVLLAGIAISRAWPAWHFLATSSLREDEILNISQFTSKGIAPAVGTYNLARNHIFFNVLNALLPGSGSTWPVRARLVSLTSVFAALTLLVAYAARRGWFLAGVAFAGFVAVDLYALKVLLEARGYGLICWFAVTSCVALCEWLRCRKPAWLAALAVSCVLGTYTLPYFVVFGGGLLVVAFLHRPSRETFLTGLLSLAAIGMLYLPVADKVLKVASGYDEEYGDSVSYNFGSIDAVYRTLQYLFSYEVTQVGPLFLLCVLLATLLFVAFGRFASRSDRQAVAGVALGILSLLAFLFVLRVVPIRVSAFLAGPLAFLGIVLTGSPLASRALLPIRPFLLLGYTVLAGTLLWRAEIREPLIPRQNWEGLARLVERAFPPSTELWAGKKYAKLLRAYLPERRIGDAERDDARFATGEVLVFDAAFKGGVERAQFTWEALPAGVRYVTFPLLVSYQRLFFLPPLDRGIAGADVDGRTIPTRVDFPQPLDPATLSWSAGDGDSLYAGAPPVAFAGEPLPVPSTLTVTLAPNAPGGVCNLLFSQDLTALRFAVHVQAADGIWRDVSAVPCGELLTVPLAKEGCRAVRVALTAREGYARGPKTSGERPPLVLMDAWTAAR